VFASAEAWSRIFFFFRFYRFECPRHRPRRRGGKKKKKMPQIRLPCLPLRNAAVQPPCSATCCHCLPAAPGSAVCALPRGVAYACAQRSRPALQAAAACFLPAAAGRARSAASSARVLRLSVPAQPTCPGGEAAGHVAGSQAVTATQAWLACAQRHACAVCKCGSSSAAGYGVQNQVVVVVRRSLPAFFLQKEEVKCR